MMQDHVNVPEISMFELADVETWGNVVVLCRPKVRPGSNMILFSSSIVEHGRWSPSLLHASLLKMLISESCETK